MSWLLLLSFLFLIKPSFLLDINGENNTIIEPLHPNITVTSGQKAILTCIFDTTNQSLSHLSNHQLIWIRQSHASYDADLILAHNDDLLISDSRLHIQRTEIDYSLTIADVTVDDEGNYACEINTQPPQKATMYLYVQEMSMIIDNATLSPIIINEYENVSMECHARGRPIPYITWFRRNKNQTSLEHQILANDTNGQLHLTNVTRYQSGRYECQVSNGVNEHIVSKEIQLRVLFSPSIRAQSTVVHGTIGKPIQLRCSATVPFDTKIYWQRLDNNTITKLRQQQHTNDDLIQTILYIKEIEKHDFGSYVCYAESMSGKSHALIELREYRRSTTEKEELSTSRIQILKRNKISDQTTAFMTFNKASTCFSLFYLPLLFIQIIFYNFT